MGFRNGIFLLAACQLALCCDGTRLRHVRGEGGGGGHTRKHEQIKAGSQGLAGGRHAATTARRNEEMGNWFVSTSKDISNWNVTAGGAA
jgi:hypothetical protein